MSSLFVRIRPTSPFASSPSPARDFPFLLDLYAAGRLDLDALVSQTYRLSEINRAFEAMLSGDFARGVVVF